MSEFVLYNAPQSTCSQRVRFVLNASWADKPAVARWYEHIRAHAAFKPTYYHGSLLTEKYPHLTKLRQKSTGAKQAN